MSSKNRIFWGSLVVVILLAVGGVYFFWQYQKTQNLLKNPVLAANIERDQLTKKISKLMELPTDEAPTVATVSDITKLKNQPFFVKAQNGDKLLIYSKAKEAILYDPKTNKIIQVGPINTGQSSSSAQQAALIKIAIYNGTSDSAFGTTTENNLKQKVTNISITSDSNAAKLTYKKTIVIDVTGTKSNVAKQLATLLGGEVGTLPAGEIKPTNADILVILGK